MTHLAAFFGVGGFLLLAFVGTDHLFEWVDRRWRRSDYAIYDTPEARLDWAHHELDAAHSVLEQWVQACDGLPDEPPPRMRMLELVRRTRELLER